ncbi:MAG TPA: oxidoreductase [Candidatus Micrarchaeia archaeon]|nr:oxidoreductase [Candidatus Micrarchaeia archaeon]
MPDLGPTPRTWFITGASSGIGRCCAEAALAAGDRVVATVRRHQDGAPLVALSPDRVRIAVADVTEPAQVRRAVATALEAFDRVDVLVNNAGYGLIGGVEEVTDAQLRRQFAVNVFGLVDVTRAVLPAMRRQGGGHVLMISSVSGQSAAPGLAYYAASKHAVEGFSESLAREVRHLGIRVTIVEPGLFRTDWAGRSLDQAAERMGVYQESAGAVRDRLVAADGNQAGDPARLAAALVRVVADDDPPLRLPMGRDAVEGIRRHMARQLEELDRWEAVAVATAFPDA